MNSIFFYICVLLLSIGLESDRPNVFAAPPKSTTFKYSLDSKLTNMLESRYSNQIYKVLKHWPPNEPGTVNLENPYWYRAIRTPSESDFIGMLRRFYVDAPAEKVAAVIEDFENYPQLFDGLAEVRITDTDNNKWTTAWTREPPIFLASKITYQMTYLIDKRDPTLLAFRYQLKESNTLKSTDGVIVIESRGNGSWVTIFDFFDCNWGVAKTLAPQRIWSDSLLGGIISDFSIKFRAEHPEWSYKKIRSEAPQHAKKHLEPIIYLEHYTFDE